MADNDFNSDGCPKDFSPRDFSETPRHRAKDAAKNAEDAGASEVNETKEFGSTDAKETKSFGHTDKPGEPGHSSAFPPRSRARRASPLTSGPPRSPPPQARELPPVRIIHLRMRRRRMLLRTATNSAPPSPLTISRFSAVTPSSRTRTRDSDSSRQQVKLLPIPARLLVIRRAR